MIVLVYVGNAFLPGVPARDLTEADIAQLAGQFPPGALTQELLDSGLYVAAPVDDVEVTNAGH